MHRFVRTAVTGLAAIAIIGGTGVSASAATPPTGSTQCKISAYITGSHTFHIKANTCKENPDDHSVGVMVVKFKFYTNNTQTAEHGVNCNADTIAKCLAEYTYTAPNPSRTQTFRVNGFAQWGTYSGRVTEDRLQTEVKA